MWALFDLLIHPIYKGCVSTECLSLYGTHTLKLGSDEWVEKRGGLEKTVINYIIFMQ